MASETDRTAPGFLTWLGVMVASSASLTIGLIVFYSLKGEFGVAVRVIMMLGVSLTCVTLLTLTLRLFRFAVSHRVRSSESKHR